MEIIPHFINASKGLGFPHPLVAERDKVLAVIMPDIALAGRFYSSATITEVRIFPRLVIIRDPKLPEEDQDFELPDRPNLIRVLCQNQHTGALWMNHVRFYIPGMYQRISYLSLISKI